MNQFALRGAELADRSQHDQIRENQARDAITIVRIETTGAGGTILPDAVNFDTAYVERPAVTCGCSILSADADSLPPLCSAGVYRWVTNERGFYTGAYVFVRVETPDALVIEHTIVIAGPAYKVLGDRATMGLDLLDLESVEDPE